MESRIDLSGINRSIQHDTITFHGACGNDGTMFGAIYYDFIQPTLGFMGVLDGLRHACHRLQGS